MKLCFILTAIVINAAVWAQYDGVRQQQLAEAEAGNPDAQRMIARMYEFGVGFEEDLEVAKLWYQKPPLRATKTRLTILKDLGSVLPKPQAQTFLLQMLK